MEQVTQDCHNTQLYSNAKLLLNAGRQRDEHFIQTNLYDFYVSYFDLPKDKEDADEFRNILLELHTVIKNNDTTDELMAHMGNLNLNDSMREIYIAIYDALILDNNDKALQIISSESVNNFV